MKTATIKKLDGTQIKVSAGSDQAGNLCLWTEPAGEKLWSDLFQRDFGRADYIPLAKSLLLTHAEYSASVNAEPPHAPTPEELGHPRHCGDCYKIEEAHAEALHRISDDKSLPRRERDVATLELADYYNGDYVSDEEVNGYEWLNGQTTLEAQGSVREIWAKHLAEETQKELSDGEAR